MIGRVICLPAHSWPANLCLRILCATVNSHRSCGSIVRSTRVSSASNGAWSFDDCLDRCLRVRRIIADSHLLVSCFDRPPCVQSATVVLLRLDGRSYNIFRACIAAGSSVTNGFSDRCLGIRRLVEASRPLCDCDEGFLCISWPKQAKKEQIFV